MDTDIDYFYQIETINIDQKKMDMLFQVFEQIYGQEFGYLRNSGKGIKIIFIEYFRRILIKKFEGYKLNYKKQKQLILLQNGDILQIQQLKDNLIINKQDYTLLITTFLLIIKIIIRIIIKNGYTNIYSQDQLIYQGMMQYGLFNGEGRIINKQNLIIYKGNFVQNKKHGYGTILYNQQYFNGQFNDDMMFGPFQIFDEQNGITYYFYNDKSVDQQEFFKQCTYTITSEQGVQTISRFIPNKEVSQSICSYREFNIQIQAYKALNPGIWLFENSLDYFLDYFKNYYSIIKKVSNLQTVIFNTNESSNFISCDYNNQFYHNEKFYQELNQNIKDKRRKVFVMNCERSHYLIMIEDNKQLYVCDSLYCQKKNLEAAYYNLLKLEDKRCIVLNCTQQKNGYDCGIFALFYAIQFMKYDNLNMVELEKKLQFRDPAQFRWELKQFVKYNHDYILTNF
ncbi:unnamed protein product [Paramecium pentaurelia]|uniref:Ubiquitin-like protease family profile domain-containing protein n=1 Tax=Paramecium pentaurelia TaxID=43138 RepID=A0A8S1SST2_9CILI|nr:unnamed protein product [Paramecium pentaurelia]